MLFGFLFFIGRVSLTCSILDQKTSGLVTGTVESQVAQDATHNTQHSLQIILGAGDSLPLISASTSYSSRVVFAGGRDRGGRVLVTEFRGVALNGLFCAVCATARATRSRPPH